MKFFLKNITLIVVILFTMSLSQAIAQESTFALAPNAVEIEQGSTENLVLNAKTVNSLQGFIFAIDYDSRYFSINDIKVGDLFDSMSEATHYTMETIESEPANSCLSDSQAITKRITVNLYFSSPHITLSGTGSLLEFSLLGNDVGAGEVCINKNESSVDSVDSGDISTTPSNITVLPPTSNEVSFTVKLEGGKSTAKVETTQGSHETQVEFEIAGNRQSRSLDASGVANLEPASNYDTISITRAGYLKVSAQNVSELPNSITLKAGDMNGDDVINILDLSTIAGKFNDSYDGTPSAVMEKMDYNGDKKVSISDLVIVAKNYGTTFEEGF